MPGTELEHLATYNQARLFHAWYPYRKDSDNGPSASAVVRRYAS